MDDGMVQFQTWVDTYIILHHISCIRNVSPFFVMFSTRYIFVSFCDKFITTPFHFKGIK